MLGSASEDRTTRAWPLLLRWEASSAAKRSGDVLRAPGVVQTIARHASIVGRIEQDDIEALVSDGGEEVAVADFNLCVEVVEHGVDARTADSARVDIDGDDVAAAARGGESASTGATAEVQDAARGWQEIGTSELRDQVGAGAEELRVEDVGEDD